MTLDNPYKVDVLAFGAHPDDIEIGCGGTLINLVSEGYSVAIVDFTRGEMGTRGTPEIRMKESELARDVIGAKFRENLGLEDGNLNISEFSIRKTVEVLRKYQPQAVLFSPKFERHPDHEALHRIVRKAMFLSGLLRYETFMDGERQPPWRIRRMYCYMQFYPFKQLPDFVVDISNVWERKLEAIRCYTSQVFVEGKNNPKEPETLLSRPEFFLDLEARARYLGSLIGVPYGEAFQSVEPIGIISISKLLF